MILTSTIYGVSIRKVSIVIKLESRGIYREIFVCTIYLELQVMVVSSLPDLIAEGKGIDFIFVSREKSRYTVYRNIHSMYADTKLF